MDRDATAIQMIFEFEAYLDRHEAELRYLRKKLASIKKEIKKKRISK